MADTPFEDALDILQNNRGLTEVDILSLRKVIDKVGYVESKNVATQKQIARGGGTGPGRGLFQYEALGIDGSSVTAKNRLAAFERTKGEISLSAADRAELNTAIPDFTNISARGQRAALLADWIMRTPSDEVAQLARGEMTAKDFWLDYHWAGHKGDPVKREAKGAQWDREMVTYEKSLVDTGHLLHLLD